MARRLGRPELVLIAVLLAVGWLSLGASNYWIGHLSDIFGSVGHVSNTFGSNVGVVSPVAAAIGGWSISAS